MFAELNIYYTRNDVEGARGRARLISEQEHLSEEEAGYMEFTGCQISQRSRDVLNDSRPDVDRDTIFKNALEAAEYRNVLRGVCEVQDLSVPQTTKQMKACVKVLFKAFKSTSEALDHEPMKRPFKEHRHDNRMVECLCWSILYAIVARSKSKNPLVNGYDSTKAKTNLKIANFAERFDATVDALAKSKTICKHLFDAPYIDVLVDDPIRACRRVETNRILNESKADIMKAGKEFKQKHGQDSEPKTTPTKRTPDYESSGTPNSDERDTSTFMTGLSRSRGDFVHKRIKSSSANEFRPYPDLRGHTGLSDSPTRMISNVNMDSFPLPPFHKSGVYVNDQPLFTSPYPNRAHMFTQSPLQGLSGAGTGMGIPGPPSCTGNPIQRFGYHGNEQVHPPLMPPSYDFPGFSQFTSLSPELQDANEEDLRDSRPSSNTGFPN